MLSESHPESAASTVHLRLLDTAQRGAFAAGRRGQAPDRASRALWDEETYLYTADDERLFTYRKTGPGQATETWTLRDLDGRVLRTYEHNTAPNQWTWKADHIYRGAQLLATATDQAVPEDQQHFTLDHLGSARLVTGSHGSPLRAHHYHGFGQEYPATSASITNPEKMRFTGHERDQHGPQGEHLDYIDARYCSPYFGRFMTMDPIHSAKMGDLQSWNKYSYGGNSPLKYVDPDGEAAVLATALVGGLADAGFQSLENALTGKPLLEGTGPAFVRGAALGLTGFGAFKVFSRGTTILKAHRGRQRMARVRQVGRAGEEAVQKAFNIGAKQRIKVPGSSRFRILDGVTKDAIFEIKNVKRQGLTKQLKDFMKSADAEGKKFVLFVRSDTQLSKPLIKALENGKIELMFIP